MPTIDEQFVEYIVKSLVSQPDEVSVKRTIDEKGVLLELTVAPDDLGRVIGKRGNTAQSIRTLLRALGTKNEARYNLKIVDVDGGSHHKSSTNSDDSDSRAEKATERTSNDSSSKPAPEEAVEGPTDETVEDSSENEESLAEKTRKELADLDDLDL